MTRLTPAQERTLLAVREAGTVGGLDTRPRHDVLHRLHRAGMLTTPRSDGALTADGEGYAAMLLAATTAKRPRPAPVPAADGRTDLVGALVHTAPSSWPNGAGDALIRALGPLDDRQRVELLAFLAAPAGAAWLGRVKDEIVVANRPGRTYAQTAQALGLSVTAINKAVSRRAAHRADAGLDV